MTSMKLTALATLVAAGVVWVAVRPLVAHHSASMFDNQKIVEISGTVKEFQWTNPHVWIQVNVDKGGTSGAPGVPGVKEEWSVEGGSPNSLSRNGWRKSTFAPGAAVSIRINPMRDGTHAGNFVGAKFADGKTIGRWE